MEFLAHNYFVAFIAGLLGGVHCIGMCGGIVSSLTLSLPAETQNSPAKMFPFIFSYNIGRIISYTTAGLFFGGLSMLTSELLSFNFFQLILKFLSALLMLALGLYLGGWWSGVSKIEQLGTPVWKAIQPFSRRFIPVNSVAKALALGLLWGWLPCGLVYTILFMAIGSASAIQGGLIMFSFAIGTLPMLLLMGVFAASMRTFMHKRIVRQAAGTMVIAFACYSLYTLFFSN